MKTKSEALILIDSLCVVVLGLTIIVTSTVRLHGAEDPAVQKILAEAKAKELHAQELRAAAASSLQKAADTIRWRPVLRNAMPVSSVPRQ